jgi:hypothetical protein
MKRIVLIGLVGLVGLMLGVAVVARTARAGGPPRDAQTAKARPGGLLLAGALMTESGAVYAPDAALLN